MQPSPEPIAPDQFGPYEVYERLGLGGMATVCRAKKRGEAGFERSVALKRMLSHLSEDQSFVESFIREAKVSSILVHPNIAQVYDFGRINGVYYIAMELVPGFDLRKLLRYANRANESIPLAVVLSILGEMCDALEYAHTCLDEQGIPLRIIHRDISPSNIIVANTGHVKVIDFGIAKANSRQLHTESGQVKGKLGYMSPEAALGMQLGPVSDVFSMGVVAWELMTASPLFSARSDFETMRKIREAEVAAPSAHNPACPPDLDRLILSALERNSERRLASAAQFRRGLDAVAARVGIQMGSRAVAEWIRQFIQPEDYSRYSGRSVPQEAPTSVLRPSQKAALQRSQDEIQLAAEIWGEDAGPQSLASQPDFVVVNPNARNLPSLAMPTAQYTPSHARGPLPLQANPSYPNLPQPPQSAPPGYMPASMQQIMPYAVPQQRATGKSGRGGLYLLLGLAVVASGLGVALGLKHNKSPDAPSAGLATIKSTIAFKVEPASAIVEVDGTPVTGEVEMTAGEHAVTAHDPTAKPLTRSITVKAGEAHQLFELALAPAVAHVSIDSNPRGLAIELDGKPAGTTPAKIEALAGSHHVVVQGATEVWTNDFVAVADAKLELMAPLATTATSSTTPTPTTTPTRPTHHDTVKHGAHHVAEVEPDKPDHTATPVPEPINEVPVPPPHVDPKPPIVVTPTGPPIEPAKPTRMPVVASTAVSKLAGDLPMMRGDHDGDVLAKMCIDESGSVTSVKLVKTAPDMPPDLAGALQKWRYRPYIGKDTKPQAVCFALSLHIVSKSDN